MATSPITFTPSLTRDAALRRACELWGIQPDYWDIFGTYHVAPADVLANILNSLGVPADSAETLDAAVEARLWKEWSLPAGPTLVVSLSDCAVPLRLPQGASADVTFEWEEGGTANVKVSADAVGLETARLRGQSFRRVAAMLPTGAALGYHTMTVRTSTGQTSTTRLILCPDRAYSPEFLKGEGKSAGIAVSLYGLKSQRNWGVGDFTDLERFTDWARDALNVSFVALNPLHSIPNRTPYNTSPYLPNCSFYRNGIYIDIERLEDLRSSRIASLLLASERFQKCLAELRAAPYVEYERVWRIKLVFLKLAFREFLRAGGSAEFTAYMRREGDLLHKFAVYQASTLR